jgi:hypothetical protein
MNRNGIVDDGLDAGFQQLVGDRGALVLSEAYDEEMIGVKSGPRSNDRQHEAGTIGEGRAIPGGGGAAMLVPSRELA